MKASDEVYYQKKPLDRLTYERLRSLNKLVRSAEFGGEKADITLVQGIGGAGASAGTHTTGGAYDITAHNQRNRCYGGRLLGGTDSFRPTLRGVWTEHIHAVTAGAGYAARLARQQVTSYWAGRNGLANNGPDNGPRLSTQPLYVAPWTERGRQGVYYLKKAYQGRVEGHTSTKAKGSKIPSGGKFTVIGVVNVSGNLWGINTNGTHVPMSVLTATKPGKPKPTAPSKPATPKPGKDFTVGSFNFPDATKIKGVAEGERIKRAVAQINGTKIDLLGVNELVGREGKGKGSSLAERLASGLGGGWDLIVPTTDANENYFLRRKATTDLVEQHADYIVAGTQGGAALGRRHLSLVTVGTPIGQIDVGLTHLVSNNRAGAEIQSALVGKALVGVAKSDQRIVLGDMNTPGPLAGLSRVGLHETRMRAKTNTSRSASTYVRYDKSTVAYDSDWIIDHIWTTIGLTPENYTVVTDADGKKKFHLPRPSDHLLIHTTLT